MTATGCATADSTNTGTLLRTQVEAGSAMVCSAIASVRNERRGGIGSKRRKSPMRRQSLLWCAMAKIPVKHQIQAKVSGGEWKKMRAPIARQNRAAARNR